MISEIIIKIGEKEIKLTLEEAKELKKDLETVFKNGVTESPFRGPVWEYPPTYPSSPNIFYGPTCGGTGDNPKRYDPSSYTTNTKGEKTI